MFDDRHYTVFDKICLHVDQALRAIWAQPKTSERIYPGLNESENDLTPETRRHAAGLMRINHAGEVCAQALYHGQGLVSERPDVKEKMQQAAREEGDHLTWCQTRLTELDSHPSYLNPIWYVGSFAIGVTAGIIGDKWSLGFLAETENQVVAHLEKHMQQLPENDKRSYKILLQMQQDEAHHRDEAIESGAAELPRWIKQWMQLASKIMVKTAYFF